MIHGEPSFGGFQMNRHGLRDDQFTRIERLLPGRPGYVGRDSELGNRLFVDDRHVICVGVGQAPDRGAGNLAGNHSLVLDLPVGAARR